MEIRSDTVVEQGTEVIVDAVTENVDPTDVFRRSTFVGVEL